MNDVLPSWNDGDAKARVVEAIQSLSDERLGGFVAPEQRIATFDNDGTLWCEKPTYIQALFLVARWKEMAEEDPTLKDVQPYRAAAEGDHVWFADIHEHTEEVVKAVCAAYQGITTDQFEDAVGKFFASARHPRFDAPLTALTYRPMRELLDLLRQSGFKVFLTTGGGRDFVRAVSEDLFCLGRENVIGSSAVLEYGDGKLIRKPALTKPLDDGPGKPVHIYERIGRPPLLAVGNADGDIPMLEMSRVAVLLRHDDAEREYAYHKGAENALVAAERGGWIVVSMKSDFARIF